MSINRLAKLINQATKEQTVEQEFLSMLNEATVRLNSETSRKPSKTYKPSSLGGCKRNIFFQRMGIEQDPSNNEASGIGIMEAGTDRHERIQKTIAEMKRLGYDVEWVDVAEYLKSRPQNGTRVVKKQGMETKLANDILNMSFLCDGIIKVNGKYFVLEIKTEASFKYQGRVSPVDKHITQGSCYSATLGIDEVLFIYENRDLCNKKVFHYHVTDIDKQTRVLDVINEVESYVENFNETKEVPAMTTVQSECRYCNYKSECKKY